MIWLTPIELAMAALVGAARHAESLAAGRLDNHGVDTEGGGLGLHIEGAAGELAVAKWKGVYFGGVVGSFKGSDLGSRVQVRTRSKHSYDLIIRPDDKDEHAYILVTGCAPCFAIRGWIWGIEGKRDEYRQDYGGRPTAFFVPQKVLRPMVKEAPGNADPSD